MFRLFHFNSIIKLLHCFWIQVIFNLHPGGFSLFHYSLFCYYQVGSRAIWYFKRYKILFNIKKLIACCSHGFVHAIWTARETLLGSQTPAFMAEFESSRQSLHLLAARVTNKLLVWHWQSFLFFSSVFSSHWFPRMPLYISKASIHVVFLWDLVLVFFFSICFILNNS